MKRPFLRVTKWLSNIPVEACCSSCSDQLFRVDSTHHRPEKIAYQRQLQVAFERHLKDVHDKDAHVAAE